MAFLDSRLGASPPPLAGAEPSTDEYACDCPGYRHLDVMRMCLRCLTAYSEGLEHAPISRLKLESEMRRVAVRLAMLLKDDPLVANLPVTAVLRAVE